MQYTSVNDKLAQHLAEFDSRIYNMRSRVVGNASYRPYTPEELRAEVEELRRDFNHYMSEFLDATEPAKMPKVADDYPGQGTALGDAVAHGHVHDRSCNLTYDELKSNNDLQYGQFGKAPYCNHPSSGDGNHCTVSDCVKYDPELKDNDDQGLVDDINFCNHPASPDFQAAAEVVTNESVPWQRRGPVRRVSDNPQA